MNSASLVIFAAIVSCISGAPALETDILLGHERELDSLDKGTTHIH